jgi:hypothetical protein
MVLAIFYIANNADDKDLILQCDDGTGSTTAYLTLDGSATKIVVDKDIYATDNVALRVGTGGDLRMLHTGTDSMMVNTNGDLYFNNQANDKDIIFKGMDNSSAITALTLDMSAAGQANFNSSISIPDAGIAYFGTGNDLQVNHDGSNSYINHVGTGHMYIQNTADDKDIILRSDDGLGGVTPYLTLDGSAGNVLFSVDTMLNGGGGYIQVDVSDDSLKFADNAKAKFGTSNDLQIYHDGTNNQVLTYNGHLTIEVGEDDHSMYLKCDNGSGGTTAYLTLDGSATSTLFHKNTFHVDGVQAIFGTGGDLGIVHDGANSYIVQGGTGNLIIRQNTNDADIIFDCDNGSGGTTAYLTLDGSSGYTKAHKHILYEDNAKAMFGTGGDMQILHDGSNSYISQNVTGAL